MIDLAVAYRIYPGISKVPAFFSTDKLKLSEMCLSSFRRALGGLRVKIWAILDGCPPEYEALFRRVFDCNELEIVQTNRIGNLATFSLQVDLLTKHSEAEYVYFAEDDYFYFPDALEKAVAFMRENQDIDFVTLYDHPDSYYTSSHFERHLVKPYGDRYWRTASSTCLTFLTSRKNLIRTRSTLKTYSRGNHDCSVWLSLTQKLSLANPRIHFCSPFRVSLWVKTWFWGFKRILFARRLLLWVPLPTLATHMESRCLSPLVDWQSEFERVQNCDPKEMK